MKKLNKLTITLSVLSLLLPACHEVEVPPKEYTVTWKNFDGSVLETDENVVEGTMPTYDGLNPTRVADEQFEYTWTGWTPSVVAVTGDVEYTATFKSETKKYDIVWKNYDGNVLGIDHVAYGETPVYNGATPTKPQTDRFSYDFIGWTPEIVPVAGAAEYTAVFEEGPRKYTVTWMNYNGVVLETDNNVPYGTVPTFDGAEPQRIGDNRFNYVFKGWSPEVGPVTGDVTYVATFTSEIKRYTITWQNYDGTTLEIDNNVPYGSVPTYDGERPTKPTMGGFKQTFAGWTPEITNVTGDQTYTAVFVNGDPTFGFERLNYTLKSGYKESDLEGAPWINSNLNNQLRMIEKPSLKDDYYASVNYENILSGNGGAFGLGDQYIQQALNDIFYGEETINNDILWAFANMVGAGDPEGVADYLASFDLDNYLSSKEAFTSIAPLYTISQEEGDYVVGFDDGYISGNTNCPSLVWLYSTYQGGEIFKQEFLKVLDVLDNAFGVSTSASEREASNNLEYTFISDAYYHYNGYYTGYTVNEIPWDQLKSAILDLGISGDEEVWIPNHYDALFNNLFNNYLINKRAALITSIKIRIELACRFLAGISNYRDLNQSLTVINRYSSGVLFGDEAYLYYYDNSSVSLKLAKAAFPVLYEQSYLASQGSEEVKAKVTEMITGIKDAFREIFAETSWLGSTTRQRAIRKIEMMSFESCYPDFYKYFVELKDDDLDTASGVTLFTRYHAGYIDTMFAGYPLPSQEWSAMPTYTNNAFYSPTTNSFVILNGLVRGCYYSEETEILYGALGAVIGHEITHGFDSSGSQFDEYGQMNNWWTDTDKNRFDAKVQKMINFYNNITLWGDTKAIGEKNNTEATADMGGVKVMLHMAKKIDNFDYDLFFRSYAYVWCRNTFGMQEAQSLREDEHPFYYLRTNVTLAQFDEFIETYNIQPGDGMYIPENQRVSIW